MFRYEIYRKHYAPEIPRRIFKDKAELKAFADKYRSGYFIAVYKNDLLKKMIDKKMRDKIDNLI